METVRALSSYGASLAIDDGCGLMAIHYAALWNHQSVVRLLLESGADALVGKTKENPDRRCGNVPRTVGQTASHYACKGGYAEAVTELLKFIPADKILSECLEWAARGGHASVVRILIRTEGIATNDCSPDSANTPLCSAAKCLDPEMVKILIDAGAEVTKTSLGRRGRFIASTVAAVATPLDAWPNGLDFLIEASADLEAIRTCGGRTPLQTALERHQDDVFEKLLSYGTSPNTQNLQGNTAPHLACAYHPSNASDRVSQVLAAGADVMIQNNADNACLFDLNGCDQKSTIKLPNFALPG